jgi:exodeoxyribonuclease VII small subunit
MEFRLTKATKSLLPKEALESELPSDPTLPQDFETALAELESLVASMESGSLTLEQSLIAYRRGAALTRICQQKLAQAEQQVKVLEAGMLRPLDTDSHEPE